MPVQWGDFEVDLEKVIGRGGMSTVYEGMQVSLKRPVAIKVLKSDLISEGHQFVERFNREAELIARLVHPNIVQVYGAGQADGRFYYAMERVEGDDLQKKIKDREPFSEKRLLEIIESVAQALDAAWKHKIIHRDIKPSNIVINPDGAVKVMDFGLAKHLDANIEKSSMVMGTPKYISPEQATGEDCDVRADIYSLGIVVYELAVGNAPFEGEDVSIMLYKHIYEAPPPPRKFRPELSEPIEMLILRCIAKLPDKRYQEPKELLEDIERIRTRQKVSGRTVSMVRKAAEVRKKKRPMGLRAGVLIGLLFVLSGLAIGVNWPKIQAMLIPPPPNNPPPPVATNGGSTTPRPVTPGAFEEYHSKGMEAYVNGQWGEAQRALQAALEQLDKSDPRVSSIQEKILAAWREELMVKGQQALSDDDFGEASRCYRELLEIFPGDRSMGERLREAEFKDGLQHAETMETELQWSQALKKYEAIRGLAPEPSLVDRGIEFCRGMESARLALDGGNPGAARELILKARSLSWREELTRELLAEAERQIKEADDRTREDRDRKFNLAMGRARRHLAEARWTQAAEQLKTAAELFPNDVMLRKTSKQVQQALASPSGMVYVPGGRFKMGNDAGPAESRPSHEEHTDAFYIDTREVTRSQYALFLQAMKDHTICHPEEPSPKDHTPMGWVAQGDPEAPVWGVDWFDAYSFAAWRGKRLPTEVEFEKAAGFDGRTMRAYPWGNHYARNGDLSHWGAQGMGSGVFEWTTAWFEPYRDSSPSSVMFGNRFRVVRGGVALEEEAKFQARVFHRRPVEPTNRRRSLGFRCVQDVR